ncbi:MAG: divalent cation tolerance protein CutA [Xanthomonadales bacterium]|nr:divalent-cation tolerance protein CutA [Xanthomonadales bacterium]NIX13609.1 divalent cation tolerance protein CutA [Xanthomonadales bacterium]
MSTVLVILCTCPDREVASRLASRLVEERLAACVNVLPEIRSIYRWEGAVSEDAEVLLVIKTMEARYGELEAWLEENHPYDVPEIVALPAAGVSAGYLAWLETATTE